MLVLKHLAGMVSMSFENQIPQFAKSDFGDKRLDKRFVKISEEFQKNPKAILSHVLLDSHQCKAAYRFFNNPQVSNSRILKSHQDHLEEDQFHRLR